MSSESAGRRTGNDAPQEEIPMARLIVSQFTTLDGVMEDPGGSERSAFGGWAFRFQRGEEGDRFKLDEVMASDALLLGRTTYEGFAEAWPSRQGDFADKFNGMQKYVVSTTLRDPGWNNTAVIADDVPARIRELKGRDGGDIIVNGSGTLVRTLADHDLVDEYRLMVFPTVVGGGKRLFPEGTAVDALELVESRRVGDDGVVILVYRPKRA
jgi:dihydrofolate reductase